MWYPRSNKKGGVGGCPGGWLLVGGLVTVVGDGRWSVVLACGGSWNVPCADSWRAWRLAGVCRVMLGRLSFGGRSLRWGW